MQSKMLLKKSLTDRTTWHDHMGFPMLTMDASFRKMTQSCQIFQSRYPRSFLILYLSYKTKLWKNVVFGTVTNKWYLTIDLLRWSYNMYCDYIHAVHNQKNLAITLSIHLHTLTHHEQKNKIKVLLYLSTNQKFCLWDTFDSPVYSYSCTWYLPNTKFAWLW